MDGSGRRKARRALLQVLCELDASGHTLDASVAWVFEQVPLSVGNESFVRERAKEVTAHRGKLDQEIQRHAPAWPVSQLPVVDRNILRIAIYEITLSTDTPPKVAINEAVELAKLFGSEGSRRFVNGVLGAIALARS
ncbi:MAG: transcription antitermination factor NusB [Chloroflexi bacterium]|nr:transcription antitermination factor NusB [Chloroflexota bacterium]